MDAVEVIDDEQAAMARGDSEAEAMGKRKCEPSINLLSSIAYIICNLGFLLTRFSLI
jgi:hypothetical protein